MRQRSHPIHRSLHFSRSLNHLFDRPYVVTQPAGHRWGVPLQRLVLPTEIISRHDNALVSRFRARVAGFFMRGNNGGVGDYSYDFWGGLGVAVLLWGFVVSFIVTGNVPYGRGSRYYV